LQSRFQPFHVIQANPQCGLKYMSFLGIPIYQGI
jgi:hypothetical protein